MVCTRIVLNVKTKIDLPVQLNFCQKYLFLHQLTYDCSLNYEFSTRKLQIQYMLCTQIVFCFCFDIHNNLSTQHVLSL